MTHDTCPLCHTPTPGPGRWDCECPDDQPEAFTAALDARTKAVQFKAAAAQHRARFRRDLPARYAAYPDTPLPAAALLPNANALAQLTDLAPGAFVYLHGDGGHGKTHFAVRLANSMISPTCQPRFVSEIDWFDHEQRRASGGEYTDFIAADALVFDDLGRRRANEFAVERLYTLLEKRWADCRTTIFTSNLAPRAAVARLTDDDVYGSGILSRLTSGHVIEFVPGLDGRAGSAL